MPYDSERFAKLEAENKSLRAVILAMAEACDDAGFRENYEVAERFRDAIVDASGLHDSLLNARFNGWESNAAALRALAGGAS